MTVSSRFHRTFATLTALFLISACAPGNDGVQNPPADKNPPQIQEPPLESAGNPAEDPKFNELPQGRNLLKLQVNGASLSYSRGTGNSFGDDKNRQYMSLKAATQADENHKVQWAFMNLDKNQVIAQSAGANRKIFGASVSKIFVAAALLDKQNGQLDNSQVQLMADMLVVSSNSAWTTLQRQIGNGDADRGRKAVHDFTQRMGYKRTRGFQGWLGSLHGNELTAAELVDFLHDTYTLSYPGAEVLWKLLHTVRTGASRGKKYMGSSIYIGGKTGTYHGTTVDPETGKSKNPDGSAYSVKVRNHAMVFNIKGVQYALAVLADTGSDESAALLAGGLIREYAN